MDEGLTIDEFTVLLNNKQYIYEKFEKLPLFHSTHF